MLGETTVLVQMCNISRDLDRQRFPLNARVGSAELTSGYCGGLNGMGRLIRYGHERRCKTPDGPGYANQKPGNEKDT